MSILYNAISRFNTILTKLTTVFFTELEQIISVCMETQKPRIAKAILRKKNRT